MIAPFICYYSQYDYGTMKQFITEEEEADFYIEKPMPIKELISLLKLFNLVWVTQLRVALQEFSTL